SPWRTDFRGDATRVNRAASWTPALVSRSAVPDCRAGSAGRGTAVGVSHAPPSRPPPHPTPDQGPGPAQSPNPAPSGPRPPSAPRIELAGAHPDRMGMPGELRHREANRGHAGGWIEREPVLDQQRRPVERPAGRRERLLDRLAGDEDARQELEVNLYLRVAAH